MRIWVVRRQYLGGRLAPADLLILLAGLCLILALLWRSNYFGLRIVAHSPAANSSDISNQPFITISFAEPLADPAALAIQTTPPFSYTTRWQDATVTLQPLQPLWPETNYEIEITAGVTGASGRQLHWPVSWRFQTRAARLLYLGWDAQERNQLFMFEPATGQRQQLTQAPLGLHDYSHDLSGDRILYSALRADGGADLWLLDLASGQHQLQLDCGQLPGAPSCQAAAWRPGSELIAYEQRPLTDVATGNEARLFWLDLTTGETKAIFSDPDWLSRGASFSPAGAWLAYLAPAEPSLRLLNLDSLEERVLPSQAGLPASWHPAGTAIIVGDLHLLAQGFAQHMYRVSLIDDTIEDLSGGIDTEEAGAVWSHDGRWLAFGRKVPRVNQGRQLWIEAVATGERQQLTADYNINHSVFAWSFDDTQLLFQRFDLTNADGRPSIWLLQLEDGAMRELVPAGFLPTWLP